MESLDHSVLQRRRELGIRIAIGARPREIVRLVTADVFAMVSPEPSRGFCSGYFP